MKAQQTIYLTDSNKAVPEGHPEAKALLVTEGVEIPDAKLAKYDGASDLAGAKAVKKAAKAAKEEEPAKAKAKH